MEMLFIPQADTIPVSWGWFHFLLLLTFPLHLLAMNAMIGGLAIGIVQHLQGGELRRELAHRIALALPLVIAFTVNFGVAPLLFLQVLYGQFMYTSSILIGLFWIMVVPVLMIAYYGAYLYDFRFKALGGVGPWLALVVLLLFLAIGFMFSSNMQLMALPEQFAVYFDHRGGTYLPTDELSLWPRYLHMMLGALAIGGLFVALLGKVGPGKNRQLAEHAGRLGLRTFLVLTLINTLAGIWYLLSLPRELMLLFMGGNWGATAAFVLALLLLAGALWAAVKGRFWSTFWHAIALVVVMTLMRSWLRSGYLQEFFTLDQLQVVPQYSPMLLFFLTLTGGIVTVAWMIKKTVEAFRQENM